MVDGRFPDLSVRAGKLGIRVRTTTDRIDVWRLTKSQVEDALKAEGLPEGWTIERGGARRVTLKGPPLSPGKIVRFPLVTERQKIPLSLNLYSRGKKYVSGSTRVRRSN